MKGRATMAVVAGLLASISWVIVQSPRINRRPADGPTTVSTDLVNSSSQGLQISSVSTAQAHRAVKSAVSTPMKSRSWDTNFLSKLSPAFEGQPIEFELADGEKAIGKVLRQQSS